MQLEAMKNESDELRSKVVLRDTWLKEKEINDLRRQLLLKEESSSSESSDTECVSKKI